MLAAGTAWWLIHSADAANGGLQMLFDNTQGAHVSAGEQIRRWLKIADLNFRGAYAWVLLAPYVFWIASRFRIERGRLWASVPAHLAACALFAAGSHFLTAHVAEKMSVVMVVADRRTGTFRLPQAPTNDLDSAPGIHEESSLRLESYPASGGSMKTRVIMSSGGAVRTFELPGTNSNGFTTNLAFPPWLDPTNSSLPGLSPEAEALFHRMRVPSGAGFASGMGQVSAWHPGGRLESSLFSDVLNVLAYLSLAGVAHAVHFYRRFRERELRASQLESNLARARLHMLQAQLQPHFLFNALNAVATLLRRDPTAALDTLTSFSDLLRLSLSQSDKHEVPLSEDLGFVQRYVEIQQTRLGARLRYEQDIEPAALDCLVPTLLIQPLVENSVKHAIERASNPGIVRVSARKNSTRLEVIVEDDGAGFVADKVEFDKGVGLSNLRARLVALYGDEQKLECVSKPEGGVKVSLELPIKTAHAEAAGEPCVS